LLGGQLREKEKPTCTAPTGSIFPLPSKVAHAHLVSPSRGEEGGLALPCSLGKGCSARLPLTHCCDTRYESLGGLKISRIEAFKNPVISPVPLIFK